MMDRIKNRIMTSSHSKVRKIKSATMNSCTRSKNIKKNTIELDIGYFQVIKMLKFLTPKVNIFIKL